MAMTPSQFADKWTTQKFTPANYDLIDDSYLREFTQDIKDVFGVEAVAVPLYKAGATYSVGNLVRFTPLGGSEGFYYALTAGKLASPQGNFTDWKEVGKPLPPTELAQAITLLQAQGLDQTSVKAGRTFLIDFGPDAQGATQTIAVRGVSNDRFDTTGTLEVGGVRTAVTAIDVQAGTWQDATLDTSNLMTLDGPQDVQSIKTWFKQLLINTLFSPVYNGADPVMLVQSEGLRWARANKLGQAVAQLAYNFNDDILALSAGQVTVPVPTNGDNAARKDMVDALATSLPLRPARTADDALTVADLGALVPVTGSAPVTLTVPPGLGLATPFGITKVSYPVQLGSGTVTLAAGPGVSLLPAPGGGLRTGGLGGRLVLLWVDANTVIVEGGV